MSKISYYESHWKRNCCPNCGQAKPTPVRVFNNYSGHSTVDDLFGFFEIFFGRCRNCHHNLYPISHKLIRIAIWIFLLGSILCAMAIYNYFFNF